MHDFSQDMHHICLQNFSGCVSGVHSFAHNDTLYSVALSPKNNVLACVGLQGIAQLWDIESHQSLGQPFHQEHYERLLCVSFSRDGKYVAYSGDDNKLTLWLVKDITSPLLEPALPDGQSTREETRSDSPPLSSCLDVSTFTFNYLPCFAHSAVAG
jgi:WD40 repeat protein